jgi:hypothetical protein
MLNLLLKNTFIWTCVFCIIGDPNSMMNKRTLYIVRSTFMSLRIIIIFSPSAYILIPIIVSELTTSTSFRCIFCLATGKKSFFLRSLLQLIDAYTDS